MLGYYQDEKMFAPQYILLYPILAYFCFLGWLSTDFSSSMALVSAVMTS